MLVQILLAGITMGCIYALVALSLNIIFNATHILNFAQGEFLMMGGMFYITFSTLGLPFFASSILSILALMVTGYIFERIAIYPLTRKHAPQISLIISTLAMSIIMKNGAELIWGKSQLGAAPVFKAPAWIIMGVSFMPQKMVVIVVTFAAVALVYWLSEHTVTGRAIRAVAINRNAAWLMGINVRRMVIVTFCISAGLSALAGFLVGPLASVQATMGTLLGVKGFSAAVIGGMGSGLGAILGGLLLGLLEALGASYISSGYSDAIAFFLMLLMLFLRPSGIVGIANSDRP